MVSEESTTCESRASGLNCASRRFRDTLKEPFCTALTQYIAASLWRALGRLSARPPPIVLMTGLSVVVVQFGSDAKAASLSFRTLLVLLL